mgnify:CR=1 FL=1
MSSQLEIAKLAFASLGKKDRALLMSELQPSTAVNIEERLIRRKDAADMLACSVRTVENYANEGLIARVKMPGRKRAFGYRYSDVQRLISGGN